MVYDLGTGSGLVAIAASKTGAAGVIATDPDPLSAVAALLNAGANGVPSFPVVPARSGDRLDIETHRSARRGDHAVLAGDLFYDERSTSTASAALDASVRMFGPESPILVGDIGRRFLPRDRLEPLASYPVRDVGDPPSAPLRDGWVFRWRP
jgi:predicted nicotinamide N-methyase